MWFATCHSYDVIKLLRKQIEYDSGVFIPVSTVVEITKKWSKIARVIAENKVAPFSGHGVYLNTTQRWMMKPHDCTFDFYTVNSLLLMVLLFI